MLRDLQVWDTNVGLGAASGLGAQFNPGSAIIIIKVLTGPNVVVVSSLDKYQAILGKKGA